MLRQYEPHFTADWFSGNSDIWRTHLSELAGGPVDYLEVGSFEGRSALFVCDLLPKARLTCIDSWPGHFAPAESVFDANIAPFAKRIRKIKGRSAASLDLLWSEGAAFDVIYIDANHTRWYAFADAILSWPMLRPNGIMIFDDYLSGLDKPRAERCKDAIDVFHRTFAECMEVLHCRRQVMVRKISDWPDGTRPKLKPTAKRTPIQALHRRYRKLRRSLPF